MTNATLVLDAAHAYTARGLLTVPVPAGSKAIRMRGWQKCRLGPEDLARHYNGNGNIGILLGEPSGWVVDVDMDCPEAGELAPRFLPATHVMTGRRCAPQSHWWYVAVGALTKQFRDPLTNAMIVELRSTGAQTLVGPSTHPSGEPYDYLDGVPPTVDADKLANGVFALARAVVVRRHGDDVAATWATNGRGTPEQKASLPPPSCRLEVRERRAKAYLATMPAAISGQGGHDRTYAAATMLVHGFELEPETALRILRDDFNPRCAPPWSAKALRHKIEDAATKPHAMPRGWLLDTPFSSSSGRRERASPRVVDTPKSDQQPPDIEPDSQENVVDESSLTADEVGLPTLGSRDPLTNRLILSPQKTLPTAIAFLDEHWTHPDRRTIVSYGDVFLAWQQNRYRQIEDGEIAHRLQPWLHEAVRIKPDGDGGFSLIRFDSNPSIVSAAVKTIRNGVYLSTRLSSPSWLAERGGRPAPLDVLPCKSMNLDLTTGAAFAPTPDLFTTNALEFDWDENAPPPARWHSFLEDAFDGDAQSIQTMREWMGYLLVADTTQQKILLMIGPPRSGKGTILRVIGELVGHGNVVAPIASSLTTQFGLQPLIGKSVALMSDARFGGQGMNVLIERLLSISGEDFLSIDRKYLGGVTMKLPTRIVIATNELPKLGDASGALPRRFIVLRLPKSFYGREDPTLSAKLALELPGILLWALDGLRSLRERGHFEQPDVTKSAASDLLDLSSPIHAFVRDRCVVGAGFRANLDALYSAWLDWCDGHRIVARGADSIFARDLQAAFTEIVSRRTTGQVRFYEGIGLRGDR